MKTCRICGSMLPDPIYTASAPSITSTTTFLDTPLSVFFCEQCLHVQSEGLQNVSAYYNTNYRISLQSNDFDQLYAVVEGKKIYRTDYQAEVALKLTNVPFGARVLDYGAAKASTLKKILGLRPDLIPFVFDVSEDYKEYWQDFVPKANQATYRIPELWEHTFPWITTHFVLEHVEKPCEIFCHLARLLKPRGVLFFSVPDVVNNYGDFIIIDHINHFSINSIQVALQKANLTLVRADRDVFRGAIICLAQHIDEAPEQLDMQDDRFIRDVTKIAHFWLNFNDRLDSMAKKLANYPSAIFGVGVYGSYIASRIQHCTLCQCFLDNNPHVQNTSYMGLPVLSPAHIPETIKVIYSGLNPKVARSVLEPLRTRHIKEIIYFDDVNL